MCGCRIHIFVLYVWVLVKTVVPWNRQYSSTEYVPRKQDCIHFVMYISFTADKNRYKRHKDKWYNLVLHLTHSGFPLIPRDHVPGRPGGLLVKQSVMYYFLLPHKKPSAFIFRILIVHLFCNLVSSPDLLADIIDITLSLLISTRSGGLLGTKLCLITTHIIKMLIPFNSFKPNSVPADRATVQGTIQTQGALLNHLPAARREKPGPGFHDSR